MLITISFGGVHCGVVSSGIDELFKDLILSFLAV